jgi:hypothetical protein
MDIGVAQLFVKVWTDVEHDDWFLGLSCLERGVWLQLLVAAKSAGNTGEISWRNLTFGAQYMACDRKTLGKILRKFHENSRLLLTESNNGVVRIILHNWQKWQQDTKKPSTGYKREKSVENPLRVEKSRVEKSRAEHTSQNSASSDACELAEFLQTKILENKPDRKLSGNWLPKTESEIDRMIRIDKRDPDTIHRVIEWCQADNKARGHGKFCWALNILSGEKLRKQFDRLESEMMAVTKQESGARDF